MPLSVQILRRGVKMLKPRMRLATTLSRLSMVLVGGPGHRPDGGAPPFTGDISTAQ